ncbi:MAG: hypothetical protein ACK5BP_13410, partial [Planctomyces sp.]
IEFCGKTLQNAVFFYDTPSLLGVALRLWASILTHVRQASKVRLTAQKTDQSSDVIPLPVRCFICFSVPFQLADDGILGRCNSDYQRGLTWDGETV